MVIKNIIYYNGRRNSHEKSIVDIKISLFCASKNSINCKFQLFQLIILIWSFESTNFLMQKKKSTTASSDNI